MTNSNDTMGILELIVMMAIFFGISVAAYVYYANQQQQCEARGGALVRGPILFACVKGA